MNNMKTAVAKISKQVINKPDSGNLNKIINKERYTDCIFIRYKGTIEVLVPQTKLGFRSRTPSYKAPGTPKQTLNH